MTKQKSVLFRWIFVALCIGVIGLSTVAQEENEPVQNLNASNILCGAPPEGVMFMRTRLTAGVRAQVLPGSSNNLRALPDASAEKVGEIPELAAFDVISGPVCTEDGYIWWQVNYDGVSGYTVEGRDGEYYLTPESPEQIASWRIEPPTALVTISPDPMFSFENIDSLNEVSRLYGNFGDVMLWGDEDFAIMVTGNAGSEGLWVYPLTDFTGEPMIFETMNQLTQVVESGAEDVIVVGSADGTIHIWNVSSDGTYVEPVVFKGYEGAVSEIAISYRTKTLASVGGMPLDTLENGIDHQNAIALWDTDTGMQTGALVGHQDTVTGIAFDPKEGRLVSGSRDGSLRLWNMTDYTQMMAIEGDVPVTALDWSSDGDVIVAGYEDGTMLLIDAKNFTSHVSVNAHAGRVQALTFSPHNLMIASSGADGRLILWDVSSMLYREADEIISAPYEIGEVQQVAFSPDSAYLATLQTNNVIRIWKPVRPDD